MTWTGKNVVVTGGSSGLGLAIARAFARRGGKVAIIGLEQNGVEQARQDLGKYTQVLPLVADIRNEADVIRCRDAIHSAWGTVDVLVNAAGRSMRGAICDTTPEQFRELFELNVVALVRITRAFLPDLLATRGHVVNIGSLASKAAARYVGAYPATKHAVAAFSQQLRLELGTKGLHVLLVCPGPIARSGPRLYRLEGEERVPEAARAPGAGVKVKAIDPDKVAEKIVTACEKRSAELVIPNRARILFALAQLFPRLGDWLILRFTPHGKRQILTRPLNLHRGEKGFQHPSCDRHRDVSP